MPNESPDAYAVPLGTPYAPGQKVRLKGGKTLVTPPLFNYRLGAVGWQPGRLLEPAMRRY